MYVCEDRGQMTITDKMIVDFATEQILMIKVEFFFELMIQMRRLSHSLQLLMSITTRDALTAIWSSWTSLFCADSAPLGLF